MIERKEIPHSFLKDTGPRLPIIALAGFALWLLNTQHYLFGGGLLVVCIGSGILVERWQSKLKCPDCGSDTSRYKPSKEPGAAIEFYCRKCNLIWDTGRRNQRGPSDDD